FGSNVKVVCVSGPPIVPLKVVRLTAAFEPRSSSPTCVKRSPTCVHTPVAYPTQLFVGQRNVAAAAAWSSGTLGMRAPLLIPDTTAPLASVTVDRSFELVWLAERAKSKLSFGFRSSSTSAPVLRAFGTFKMMREEQVPAVTVACRFLTSDVNAATLNVPRPPMILDFVPTS